MGQCSQNAAGKGAGIPAVVAGPTARYEQLRLLGKGEFGQVWVARDVDTGRQYALKMIPRKRKPRKSDRRPDVESEVLKAVSTATRTSTLSSTSWASVSSVSESRKGLCAVSSQGVKYASAAGAGRAASLPMPLSLACSPATPGGVGRPEQAGPAQAALSERPLGVCPLNVSSGARPAAGSAARLRNVLSSPLECGSVTYGDAGAGGAVHIVGVHECFTLDAPRTEVLVMELVPGGSLLDVVSKGPAPDSDTATWGAQLSSALAYLHELGFMHRDVAPGNVVLTEGRDAKLVDFGHACRISEPDCWLPQLSPESLIVRGGRSVPPHDERVDHFGLGVLLYALCKEHIDVVELVGSPPSYDALLRTGDAAVGRRIAPLRAAGTAPALCDAMAGLLRVDAARRLPLRAAAQQLGTVAPGRAAAPCVVEGMPRTTLARGRMYREVNQELQQQVEAMDLRNIAAVPVAESDEEDGGCATPRGSPPSAPAGKLPAVAKG